MSLKTLAVVPIAILDAIFFIVWIILYSAGPPFLVRTFGLLWSLLSLAAILIVLFTTPALPSTLICSYTPSSLVWSEEIAFELHQAKMKFAWEWFTYHADQRLKAFNFFLVILGILVVAYGAAMKEGLTAGRNTEGTATNASTTITTTTTTVTTTTRTNRNDAVSSNPVIAAPASSVSSAKPMDAKAATPYAVLAGIISLYGILISIGFWMIEIRNVELVECGREWLDLLEADLGMSLRREDKGRKHLRKAIRPRLPSSLTMRSNVVSHWLWMRAIYFLSCVGFVFGLNAAFWGFD